MNSIRLRLLRSRRVIGACVLSTLMLVACGKSTLPVSIHGVNYSVEPFSFEVKDPIDPSNNGDGELVDSAVAGLLGPRYVLPPGDRVREEQLPTVTGHGIGRRPAHPRLVCELEEPLVDDVVRPIRKISLDVLKPLHSSHPYRDLQVLATTRRCAAFAAPVVAAWSPGGDWLWRTCCSGACRPGRV